MALDSYNTDIIVCTVDGNGKSNTQPNGAKW